MRPLPGRLLECFGAKTPKKVQKINNLIEIPTSSYLTALNWFLETHPTDWTPPGRKICGVLLSSGMLHGKYVEGKWVDVSSEHAVVVPYTWIELVTGHIIDPCRWFMLGRHRPILDIVKEPDYYDKDNSLLKNKVNITPTTHKDYRPDFYAFMTQSEKSFIENLFGFPEKITQDHISFLVNKVKCPFSSIYTQNAIECGLIHLINDSILNIYYEDSHEYNTTSETVQGT